MVCKLHLNSCFFKKAPQLSHWLSQDLEPLPYCPLHRFNLTNEGQCGIEVAEFESDWVHIQALLLTNCVTMGKLLNLLVPQFPQI